MVILAILAIIAWGLIILNMVKIGVYSNDRNESKMEKIASNDNLWPKTKISLHIIVFFCVFFLLDLGQKMTTLEGALQT